MTAGDTFLALDYQPPHLWMILSDPGQDPQRVILVNFTSWKPYHEQHCIVEPGEHPFVIHRTCINYRRSREVTLAALEVLVKWRKALPQQAVDAVLLGRIQAAATLSSLMPASHKQILRDQGVIP